MMNEIDIPTEVLKYETYINEVLRTDLNKICIELGHVTADIAEYRQLTETINLLHEFKETDQVYKTMMDIGCNYFMQTRVEDLSNILLDVGFGCYLELTLDEALKFIEAKVKFLNNKQTFLREKSAKIKAHIKFMLLCINQLCDTDDKKKNKTE